MSKPLFVGTVLGALGGGMLLGFALTCADAAQAKRPTVQELQAERIKTLALVVTLLEAESERGAVDLDRLLNAQERLLAARYESANSKAKRIALRKEQLAAAKRRELLFEARFQIATASRVDQLDARASRLEAEILLTLEQNR